MHFTQLSEFLDSVYAWLAIYALKIPAALIILIIGLWLAKKIANLTFRIGERRGLDSTVGSFLKGIIYYFLLAAVVVSALGQLGVNVTSLLAILGAASLAVGLALKDSLSNFAAGVMLILLRYFKAGDWVTVSSTSGTVERVTIFSTVLNTADNQRVIVPNSLIVSNVITNTTANDIRRVDLVFGIGYSDDIDKARAIINEQLKDPRVLSDPAPLIAVDELADSSVNFVVRPWVKGEDYWGLRRDLIEKVKKAFDQNGISIPFPQTDVHLFKEGNEQ